MAAEAELEHVNQEDTQDSVTKDTFDFAAGKFEEPGDSAAASAFDFEPLEASEDTCVLAMEDA